MKTKILPLALMNVASNYQANVVLASTDAEPTSPPPALDPTPEGATGDGVPTAVKASVAASTLKFKVFRLFGYNTCPQDVYIQLWDGYSVAEDGTIEFEELPVDGSASTERTLLASKRVFGQLMYDISFEGLDVTAAIAAVSVVESILDITGLEQAVSANLEIETI